MFTPSVLGHVRYRIMWWLHLFSNKVISWNAHAIKQSMILTEWVWKLNLMNMLFRVFHSNQQQLIIGNPNISATMQHEGSVAHWWGLLHGSWKVWGLLHGSYWFSCNQLLLVWVKNTEITWIEYPTNSLHRVVWRKLVHLLPISTTVSDAVVISWHLWWEKNKPLPKTHNFGTWKITYM